MKNIKEKNFEKELPSGYKQALYINAKSAKFGIIFNLIALVVAVIVMALAVISLNLGNRLSPSSFKTAPSHLLLAYLVFLAAMIAYIVLHELVHGIAYKVLTGEKLTFGLSWSCAFCGVPHIYTYRKSAFISAIAPFTVFTLVFLPILAVFYYFNPLYYLMAAFIFSLHLGGCSGDLYIISLLSFKFRNEKTLMRDTGPEQFFYIPDDTSVASEN